MNKIIVLRGLPASGKSTYAKKLIEENPNKYKRINKDDLRSMLDGGKWSKNNEAFIVEARDALVKLALTNNYIPIVDDTNLHQKHIETLKNFGELEIIDFDTPVFECIERDLKRPNPVGAEVILRMFNDFVKPEKPSTGTPAIIVDIDGTLAKMQGRHPYEWGRVGEDKPVLEIIEIVKRFSNTHQIIVMSGRNEICREGTVAWLNKNGIPFASLFMRKESDTRKDYEVKKGFYNFFIKDNFKVDFVLDDRNQVVDLWRSLGLICLQCDYGNF